MGKNKKRTKAIVSLVLSLTIFSITGASMLVGNQVSAAEIQAPKTIFQTQESSTKLKDSLSNALFKFVEFIQDSLSETSDKRSKNKKSLSSKAEVEQERMMDDVFDDVVYHPNKYYINYLAENQIISKSKNFHPENFLRLNELSKILVNSYRFKVGYKLETNVGLSNKNYFDKLMPKYYNTAYEIGFLSNIDNLEDYERFVSPSELKQILENFKRQYPELINLYYLELDLNANTIKRGDFAKLVFEVLMLNIDKESNVSYQDIYYHPNFDAIQTLANLEILNTQNSKFYPDNNISRGDFILMLVKSYIKVNNKELKVANIDFDIEDLDYNSTYAPYVLFAKQEGLIDYLFEITREKNYINLEKRMSKHEVYYIMSSLSELNLHYDIVKADREFVTRGEVVQLIVDAFGFGSKEQKNVAYVPNSQLEKFIMNVKSFTKLFN